jgi:hypothetical protein
VGQDSVASAENLYEGVVLLRALIENIISPSNGTSKAA